MFQKKTTNKISISRVSEITCTIIRCAALSLQSQYNTNNMLLLRLLAYVLLFCGLGHQAAAQIFVGQDTLYGNEWIDFDRTYYKLNVLDDGICRIGTNVLLNAGLPVGSIVGSDWRVFRHGAQVPIHASTTGVFGPSDFIEFFGQKNRTEIEQHLYDDPAAQMLNPWHSLFSDTSAYYLVQAPNLPALRLTPTPNNLSNLPSAEPFCWRTQTQVLASGYAKRQIAEDVIYSWFNGDGFHGGAATELAYSVTPTELFTGTSANARFRIRYGANQLAHKTSLKLNGSEVAFDQYYNWKLFDRSFDLPLSAFAPALSINVDGTDGPTDRSFVAGYELRYPATFNFTGQKTRFEIEGNLQDKYLEINGLDVAGGTPILYDITNNLRIVTDLDGTKVRVRLPANTNVRQIVVATPNAGITNIVSLRPVNFRNYTLEPSADYIIVSNKKLYKDPQDNNTDHVAAYADYRRSAAGGSHKVAIVDVTELYEQFGFGLANNPLAMRNFTHFIKKKWPNASNLFIIGKGLEYQSLRANSTYSTLVDSLHHVPMYGFPATDQMFVMRRGGISEPLMSVGRIAVTKPSQILDYLDKVRDLEAEQQNAPQTLDGRAWMKRVIHASGGTVDDASLLRTYVDQLATVIRDNRFGADVRRFYKVSNDPVQSSGFEEIKTLVNQGVSMWMIFGHSAPNIVDFDIGISSNYANRPRYPFLMIMGCFTGTCSLPTQGIGEDYVLAPDRGAIAYAASVYYGFTSALNSFGNGLYDQMGGPQYGKSIGEAMRANIATHANTQDPTLIALYHQYALQGDPAVHTQTAPGPDYVLDPQSVELDPNPIPTEKETFDLSFDLVNIGENKAAQIAVKVEERQPDNSLKTIVLDTVSAPALRNKLYYTINNANAQTGYHRFLFQADVFNAVEEQPAAAELNNNLVASNGEAGVEVYFYANDVQPAFPPDFAIVPKQQVVLHASASGGGQLVRYLFELDTLETFTSPYKRSTEFNQAGGLMRWPQNLGLPDSTVVYWRVARDSIVNGQVLWKTSSFLYLEGSKPGWNQSDFGQYKTNLFTTQVADEAKRKIEFSNNVSYLLLNIGLREGGTFPGMRNSFNEGILSNFRLNEAGFFGGAAIMVHDPNTGRVIWNPPGGPHNPAPSDKRKFFFHFDTADSLRRVAMMEFIKNDIPDGAIVGVFISNASWGGYSSAPKDWAKDSISYGSNLFQVFESVGAKQVREMADYPANVPPAYGLIFKKNDANFEPIDTIVRTQGQYLELRSNYTARWFTGDMASRRIGPAKAWNSLHFRPAASDAPQDEVQLQLYGIRPDGTDSLLMTFANAADTSLQAFTVAQFPFLRMAYTSTDSVLHTAQPLHYARVLYDPIPEGALDPAAKFEFASDTLERGDVVRTRMAFANISNANFDTLLVRYRIENQSGSPVEFIQKTRALAIGDTLHVTGILPTKNLPTGAQRLLVDVNPDNDQPELYHFNNVLFRGFYVRGDQRNPLLDVTFDGNRLMDGDLISPKPVVNVRLADENRFLALGDTSLFEIMVVFPDGSKRLLPFGDPSVVFFPASGNLDSKNEARVEWRPFFDQDGDYELTAQARDASGNTSGNQKYNVRFKVINKSSISNVLNYPNPFSTSTCFYYTMTGFETPTRFKLQIMTVSGKVVREVTEEEFGPLQAGTHQSQFCWDGKDAFGDQLANGVYLYKITARKQDGAPFEFFEQTAIDGYFKGGIGKMVLVR